MLLLSDNCRVKAEKLKAFFFGRKENEEIQRKMAKFLHHHYGVIHLERRGDGGRLGYFPDRTNFNRNMNQPSSFLTPACLSHHHSIPLYLSIYLSLLVLIPAFLHFPALTDSPSSLCACVLIGLAGSLQKNDDPIKRERQTQT